VVLGEAVRSGATTIAASAVAAIPPAANAPRLENHTLHVAGAFLDQQTAGGNASPWTAGSST